MSIHSQLTKSESRVFNHFRHLATENFFGLPDFYQSIPQIERYFKTHTDEAISEPTIRRSITKLESLGVLNVSRKRGCKSRYQLCFERIHQLESGEITLINLRELFELRIIGSDTEQAAPQHIQSTYFQYGLKNKTISKLFNTFCLWCKQYFYDDAISVSQLNSNIESMINELHKGIENVH